MARSKKEEAEWASHRHELQSLWLDQRWSVEQIQEHMSRSYNFCKRSAASLERFPAAQLTIVAAKTSITDSSRSGISKRTPEKRSGVLLRTVVRNVNERGKTLERSRCTVLTSPTQRLERKQLAMFHCHLSTWD